MKFINPTTIIIALVNGMVGSVTLIVPVQSLRGGILLTPFAIILSGLLSYYSSYLYVSHLGTSSDIDSAIVGHFYGNRTHQKIARIIYSLFLFIDLLLLLSVYFKLIVTQWVGLV
jgi:amino acid permease